EVKKEPAYRTTPKYGVIQLGNGPKSKYVIVLDEPANADWRIYLDKNRNGNLADDGDGSWTKKDVNQRSGRTMYGINSYTLRASYGSDRRESRSADYGLSFYRFADIKYLLMYR